MSYSQAELEEYWNTVQDGSVLNNAAPNNFEGSDTFSPNQTSDLGDIRDTSFLDRQAAMDFSERYKTDPEQAKLTSERMNELLDEDSTYIQRARTKANEAAGGKGLLNSSMASGAAEGAAIDRGLQVAQSDTDVDKFNVGLEEEKQEDALETQEKDYEYKQWLQDSAAADQMEQDVLQYTNERAMEILKQTSGLHAAYLEAYGQIAMADISKSDKNAQLRKLGQQITNATIAAESYKDVQITGDNVPSMNITGIPDTVPNAELDAEVIAEAEAEGVDVSDEEALMAWFAASPLNI